MPWWHEDYLDKLDLYFHFTALANFTKDLPLGTARWQPLATALPEFLDKGRKPETRDVVILTVSRWGKDEQSEFSIRADGTVADDLIPRRLLHGGGHRDLKSPPTFVVIHCCLERHARPSRYLTCPAQADCAGADQPIGMEWRCLQQHRA